LRGNGDGQEYLWKTEEEFLFPSPCGVVVMNPKWRGR